MLLFDTLNAIKVVLSPGESTCKQSSDFIVHKNPWRVVNMKILGFPVLLLRCTMETVQI